ncbi:MAG: hypothetical protein UU47_C0001G0111 [candidate division TM6 bacterium GW2011_GWE2_41_16]|nr:MAG: hypothetical protein UU47_C0001G0111 [candidate division TM6 bacterium GW2011_GWE2_41_16]
MKSLVQEASSLAKAIEAAWQHADKPQEFSVRILQYPTKNFLGLTKLSAKIAIFFDDQKAVQSAQHDKKRAPQKDQRPQITAQPQRTQPKIDRPKFAEKPASAPQRSVQPPVQKNIQPLQQEKSAQPLPQEKSAYAQSSVERAPQWNNEHIEAARAWTNTVLGYIDQQSNSFTVTHEKMTLKVLFKQQIIGPSKESSQERRVLANFSILLMTTLKKQFRTSLRGHKILFSHQ